MTARVARLVGSLLLGLVGVACDDRTDREAEPRRRDWSARASQERGELRGSGDNVVLIVIDTLRSDKLGCYGFPLDTSPEIDRLAARGARFEQVLAQCSWTRPSIGSMITGHYPRTLGLYRGRDEILDDRFDTLAEVLAAAGYVTIGITANPQIGSRLGFGQGFHVYADSPQDLERLVGADPRELPDEPGGPDELHRYGRMPSALVLERALAAVERAPAGPRFLFLNLMEAHTRGPRVRPEFRARFAGHRSARYLRAVRQISHDVGRFLDDLLARPGWEQTLVILTSDHGEGLTDHPGIRDGFRHGFLLYESHLRVPLLVLHSGGRVEPAVVARPVRNLDLAPTVLGLLGVPAPDGVEGRSLAPLLAAPRGEVDLPARFVAETYRPKAAKIAIYGERWKYFENRDDWPLLGPQELQARGEREIGRFTDRIDTQPAAARELEEALERWERAHPKADPTYGRARMPPGLLRRLKSLGYLDDPEDGGAELRPPGPP